MMANSHGKQNNPNIPNEGRETSSASDNLQLDNNDPSRRSNVGHHGHDRLDKHAGHHKKIRAQQVTRKVPKGPVPYTKAQSKYGASAKPSKVVGIAIQRYRVEKKCISRQLYDHMIILQRQQLRAKTHQNLLDIQS